MIQTLVRRVLSGDLVANVPKMSIAIGIDLGTSNTCVAVYRDKTVEIIENEVGRPITPSYVSYTQDGRFVGDVARDKAVLEPKNTIFDVKRLIGRKFNDPSVQDDIKNWPFEVVNVDSTPKIKVVYRENTKLYNPEEISSMILEKMKDAAEKHLGAPVKECVITVPAYFNDSQRQATIDAGRLANLKVLRIVNEPTAAAIAYSVKNRKSSESTILVYDLGGGTFDVSILKVNGNKIRVLATSGNTHLGGADFDGNMMDHLIDNFKREHGGDLRSDEKSLRRLRFMCEKSKKTLSESTTARISLPSILNDIDLEIEITRKTFEDLNERLFESTLRTVESCLRDAKLDKSKIDEVVLVGGSTRIPKVRNLIEEMFQGKPINVSINPDHAVAHGASILAHVLHQQANSAVKEVSLTDVTPFSLGLELMGNEMGFVISKNSTLPTKHMKTYHPEIDYQVNFLLDVFEGENRLASHNNLLGTFTLYDIPSRPMFQTNLDVTFEIDDNGILTVSCKDRGSEMEENIKIFYDKGRMTEEQITSVREEARQFKEKEKERRMKNDAMSTLYIYCDEILHSIKHKTLIVDDYAKKELTIICNDALKWLDSNQSFNAERYREKLDEVKDLCKPYTD